MNQVVAAVRTRLADEGRARASASQRQCRAAVLPSTLSSVVDRTKTTAYIVQSALFLLGVHAAVLALGRWDGQQYTVAVTQTCVMHMLCSQYRTLVRHKHLLVYQGLVRCLLALMAAVSWRSWRWRL